MFAEIDMNYSFKLTGSIIKNAREGAEMTSQEFADFFRVSRQTVSSWENADEPNIRPKIKANLIEFITAGFHNKFEKIGSKLYKIRVPFILSNNLETYLETKDIGDIYLDFFISDYPKGFHIAFQVASDAMNDGSRESLRKSDIALCREIKREYFAKNFSEDLFWILVLDDSLLITQITEYNREENNINCHFLNPIKKKKDHSLKLNEVNKIYQVVQRVTAF